MRAAFDHRRIGAKKFPPFFFLRCSLFFVLLFALSAKSLQIASDTFPSLHAALPGHMSSFHGRARQDTNSQRPSAFYGMWPRRDMSWNRALFLHLHGATRDAGCDSSMELGRSPVGSGCQWLTFRLFYLVLGNRISKVLDELWGHHKYAYNFWAMDLDHVLCFAGNSS